MILSKPATIAAILAGGFSLIESAHADVRLPSIISDHMVLQRDTKTAVWGWAEPGEAVSVSISGQTRTTTTEANGKWLVRLENLASGPPTTLTVEGKNTLTVNDVLIGEVWLASGQSNMQLNLSAVKNSSQEVAAAEFPEVRMFTVDHTTAIEPQQDCAGKWVVSSPETAAKFSAVAYFFGRDLQQALKVPVGLIHASWGGTPIEAWTSMEAQKDKPELLPLFSSWKSRTSVAFDEKKAAAQYKTRLGVWEKQVVKAKAAGKKLPQRPIEAIAPRLQPKHPANLFNAMIAPLIPYTLRGAIWYQGEANANGNGARIYKAQLATLLADWRTRWGQGDFPFAWVQLPNFKVRSNDPAAASSWATMREVFLNSLAIPNTGMAIAIDVGDAKNIHPKDKQTIGKRLSLWARAKVYGENIPFSGPLPVGHETKGAEIMISFTHADGGLKAKGGTLKGFAIAGADKKWVWANARIEGDSVVVSSSEVSYPVAVRYAWGDNPECNLFNTADLPASPFRTDDW